MRYLIGVMPSFAPDLPAWIPAFSSIVILTVLNFVAVKLLVKSNSVVLMIFAIILLLMVGIYLSPLVLFLQMVLKPLWHMLSIGNPRFLAVSVVSAGFQIAVFAFVGIEWFRQLQQKPKIRIPLYHAINSFLYDLAVSCWRTGLYYCKSRLGHISHPDKSPFVEMFT